MRTSLTSSRSWNRSWPSGRRRSTVTQRLLRLTLFHTRPISSRRLPHVRRGSPAPGGSTLMTSAPNSPRAVPTIGPAANVAHSITRTPSSGSVRSAMHSRWAREPEVLAERLPGVAIAEKPAPLELGHDEPDDVLVGAGG